MGGITFVSSGNRRNFFYYSRSIVTFDARRIACRTASYTVVYKFIFLLRTLARARTAYLGDKYRYATEIRYRDDVTRSRVPRARPRHLLRAIASIGFLKSPAQTDGDTTYRRRFSRLRRKEGTAESKSDTIGIHIRSLSLIRIDTYRASGAENMIASSPVV